MGKSTTLGIGLLAVLGAGAYIYLKNKKATTPSGIIDNTTNKTGIVTPPKKGLLPSFLGGTPPKASTPSIADTSLGLQPTTTTATIDETKTNNYIIAKNLSLEIMDLQKKINNLSIDFQKIFPKSRMEMDMYQNMEVDRERKTKVDLPKMVMTRDMQKKSKEANALGYKILPYGLIEKM